jgi:hypothetical protein
MIGISGYTPWHTFLIVKGNVSVGIWAIGLRNEVNGKAPHQAQYKSAKSAFIRVKICTECPNQDMLTNMGKYCMISPHSMTQMSNRMACMVLYRRKWFNFTLRTTARNRVKNVTNGMNELL